MIGVVAIFKDLCETTRYIGWSDTYLFSSINKCKFSGLRKEERKHPPKTRFKDITMH